MVRKIAEVQAGIMVAMAAGDVDALEKLFAEKRMAQAEVDRETAAAEAAKRRAEGVAHDEFLKGLPAKVQGIKLPEGYTLSASLKRDDAGAWTDFAVVVALGPVKATALVYDAIAPVLAKAPASLKTVSITWDGKTAPVIGTTRPRVAKGTGNGGNGRKGIGYVGPQGGEPVTLDSAFKAVATPAEVQALATKLAAAGQSDAAQGSATYQHKVRVVVAHGWARADAGTVKAMSTKATAKDDGDAGDDK